MAETESAYGLAHRLDIKQILSEAKHRWLRPAEICEILRCYEHFQVSPQPPNKPISGSVFLFDRKVLRYFRKDGHNWRKKKDGKTVKEAHEKLKVGSVDMLHCYYAHGEDNDFQRRSYWLLEQNLTHIVFVHYLEVRGNKNGSYVRNIEAEPSYSENGMPFHGTSPTNTMSSANEGAESEDNHQEISRFLSNAESPLTDDGDAGLSNFDGLLRHSGNQQFTAPDYTSLSQGTREGAFSGDSFVSGFHATANTLEEQESRCSLPSQANWRPTYEDCSFANLNRNFMLNSAHVPGSTLLEEKSLLPNQKSDMGHSYTCPDEHKQQFELSNLQMLISESEFGTMHSNWDNAGSIFGNQNCSFLLKMPTKNGLLAEESLKKVDSFSRWVDKELGEADELQMKSAIGSSWSLMGSEDDSNMRNQLQEYIEPLNPSISQDQLFSIIDFLPNWVYSNSEAQVLVAGNFLKSEQELANCRWSIMFGEVEVPAEVLADGFLCCYTPQHNPGLVPFYVTSSNRLACSEIRQFEFRFREYQDSDVSVHDATVMQLQQQFEKLLDMGPVGCQVSSVEDVFEKQNVVKAIISCMEEEKRLDAQLVSVNSTPQLKMIGKQILEKPLKEKFYNWIIQLITEGKGAIFVDERGQGALHLVAALGFNWALQPIIVSGVSIDFRDVNGWTSLHWAAFCGREDTVAALVSLGAYPGALTDPSSEYPLGRTPADLAAANGHKGISGFLAETSLTTHLSSLGVTDRQKEGTAEVPAVKEAIQTLEERVAVPNSEKDIPDALSLKDSLAAVCNATQAVARIHQIYRIQSFQRKQLSKQEPEELSPDEKIFSLVSAKTNRLGNSVGVTNAAATRIQKKFRGWKMRKEFLLLRQRVVKIQAHIRGHQVRKKYKPIIWSVGIMEKVILRWRRKGKGLRGFQSDGMSKEPRTQATLLHEDNYDLLKEGRKQAEERMRKALSRVKSMVQYPEARAQYRRLLTSAEGFRENKSSSVGSGKGKSNFGPAKYGFSLVKGKANHPMEDYLVAKFVQVQGRELGLFAIYDGHLGDSVPAYLQKHLFQNILNEEEFWTDPGRSIAKAYERTDQAILSHNPELGRGGSTAVNAILINCRRLWVANVGDSRAVLSRRREAIQMTIDHEPNTERDDIENKGGFVSNMPGDVARVNGQLAVSRAFGDKNLKSHLRSDPDITNADIDSETDLLILASDGLWKVMSNQEAVDIAKKIRNPQKAAKQLATEALNRDSKDDISCIVVRF